MWTDKWDRDDRIDRQNQCASRFHTKRLVRLMRLVRPKTLYIICPCDITRLFICLFRRISCKLCSSDGSELHFSRDNGCLNQTWQTIFRPPDHASGSSYGSRRSQDALKPKDCFQCGSFYTDRSDELNVVSLWNVCCPYSLFEIWADCCKLPPIPIIWCSQ